MAKGLLLGNGVNICMGIKELESSRIGERFRKNVSIYVEIIQNLFGVQVEEFLIQLETVSEKTDIESLADMLYRYIRENKIGTWLDNDEYRIQDVITCICITSIFYNEDGKIHPNCDITKLPQMQGYDYIFSLNYFEYWDDEKKCTHLHGKIDLSELRNEKNAILVSSIRMHLPEYAKAVEAIKKKYNVIEYTIDDIILAPKSIEKKKLVCVTGVLVSENLLCSDDLYMYTPKDLYVELGKVDELDIFGMSPYGDKSIVDEINKIERVRVFVYDRDNNEQTKAWREMLTCRYELLDSYEMQ